MSSVYLSVDDTDLDDAELWAVIDSAAAAHSASNSHARRPSSLKHNHASMPSVSPISPTTRICKNPRPAYTVEEDGGSPSADGEVLEEPWASRPRKMMRMAGGGDRFDCGKQIVAIHRNPGRSQGYSSSSVVPERYGVQEMYPVMRNLDMEANRRLPNENFEHSLSLKMPSVSLFKQYQNAAMAILEKGDYTMIAGHPFIKKTGVGGSQMDGAHANVERKNSRNQIMISQARRKPELRIKHAKTCLELESTGLELPLLNAKISVSS
ncbi:uncharacterized protein LOC116256416 isoform X2 [Nymphaea colorata]|uniref:uncharacterized protein LOC116256416 isoform X2 n=1 Tax=Nymphaea colorata TaxID=210225 RepID=UPI00214ED631|nr:uncharacterized protein LOC116256416 isoform X2 [Nymphaea colorata]